MYKLSSITKSLKHIGGGYYGKVYELDDNTVLKVSYQKDIYNAYVQYCLLHKCSEPWMPEIYKVQERVAKNEYGQLVNLITMKRYKEASTDYFQRDLLKSELAGFWNYLESLGMKVKRGNNLLWASIHEENESDPSRKDRPRLDLHRENVMYDKSTDNLIITDPIAGLWRKRTPLCPLFSTPKKKVIKHT